MTISSLNVKNSYSGNGSTTTFTYTFLITDEDHIQVIIRDSAGVETIKTKTTHYSVTGVNNSGGGSVIFTAGNIPSATDTIVLARVTPQTQGLDLIENDPLPANSLETAFDKITAIAQEVQEEVNRSIKISKTNTINDPEINFSPTQRAGKILSFDSTGELSVDQELGSNRGTWSAGVSYAERDIVKDGSNNNVYYAIVAHTSSGSTPLSSNVDIAKWSLLVDAESATTAATQAQASAATAISNASTSSTNAATASTQAGLAQASATAAATSEANASTSATNSANSATASANSASAAATSETNAAASAASAAASSGGGVVKVSTTDTTANFLNDKIEVGLGLKKEITNASANEKFKISSNAVAFAIALGG